MKAERHTIKTSSGDERCFYCGKVGGHPKIVCKKCGGLHQTDMHDLPRRGEGIAIFEPTEMGYLCPEKHRASDLSWSEFKDHIWCCVCEKDYKSADCFLQRPYYWTKAEWQTHLKHLPFKAKVLPGLLKTKNNEWR